MHSLPWKKLRWKSLYYIRMIISLGFNEISDKIGKPSQHAVIVFKFFVYEYFIGIEKK
jgi:hypothetical protein